MLESQDSFCADLAQGRRSKDAQTRREETAQRAQGIEAVFGVH
jgi:hypothetical protein